MTTIVLAHPSAERPRFQVFAIYEAPHVHRVFALREIAAHHEAERAARQMMEDFEADHFRRVVEVGERTFGVR
jgi:hypothetical protein